MKSLGDGHCLIHSVCALTNTVSKDILLNVTRYVSAHPIVYSDFINAAEMTKGLHDYVNLKVYNSNFCDVLPKILCDCFDVSIIILSSQGNGDFNFVCIEPDLLEPYSPLLSPNELAGQKLVLLKTLEHYDAIKPCLIAPINSAHKFLIDFPVTS